MTRIRYKRYNNLLRAKQLFLVEKRLVRLVLNLETLEGLLESVTDIESTTLATFHASNLQALKKLAKQTLVDLGVNFQDEVRPGKHLKELSNAKCEQKEESKAQEV